MAEPAKWRAFWEQKTSDAVSDYEFDRGANTRPSDIEELSTCEFLEFVEPRGEEIILDAGCGTGANLVKLHTRVRRLVAVDFSEEAIARCRRRVQLHGIANADVHLAGVTALPLPDGAVDKVICMSVLHYLDDTEVQTALREFARVLKKDGTLILHVKNSSSLYLSTLSLLKRVKTALGATVKFEHFRPFAWYSRLLRASSFRLDDYNSFNLLIIEGLPRRTVHFLQRLELEHYKQLPLRLPFLRRHGADLKLKARRA